MSQGYDKAIVIREQLRTLTARRFAADAHVFDYVWDSLWGIAGAKRIEDFADVSGWSFQSASIEEGGISGGACSPETLQAMLCYLHVATSMLMEDEVGEFSVAHVEEQLEVAGGKLGLLPRVIEILKEDGPYMLERLENALREQVEADDDERPQAAPLKEDCRWCVWLVPGESFQHDGALTKEQIETKRSAHDFDIIIDEPINKILIRHRGETDAVEAYAIDQVNSNELGMLWLLMTRAKQGYITDDDFQIVRRKAAKLDRKTAYKNYRDKFRDWAGKEIAARWHGHHGSGRISVNGGGVGYLWVRQHKDPHCSKLMLKSVNYREP